MLAALGVVYGDIGTSPLYALQTVFALDNGQVHPDAHDVFGVVSLVFWSITLIVSLKYVMFVMRADNDGEGGVMALAALARQALERASARRAAVVLTLGVLGAALFYGDSVITPAISVLSAIEGLEVSSPGLSAPGAAAGGGDPDRAVRGAAVRHAAGGRPVRPGDGGVVRRHRRSRPARTSSPARASCAACPPVTRWSSWWTGPSPRSWRWARWCWRSPGAEALYADMGHFGAAPIRRAWFALVFPALTLNYLAQGALILRDPASRANPFFLLLPHWARLPMVVLATVATVIASQAVISGAYSMTRQALRLGFLPHLRIRQTSEEHEGQIYLPAVNAALFVGGAGGDLRLRFLHPAGYRLRRRGDRHLPDHHHPAAGGGAHPLALADLAAGRRRARLRCSPSSPTSPPTSPRSPTAAG